MKQLVRHKLRVWDDNAQARQDFYWEPEVGAPSPAAELVEGRGTLTWRKRGAPSYDRISTVSRYVGEMKGGKRHGRGRQESADGAIYEGDWADDLMDGHGYLRLANGDAYRGALQRGQMHGRGVYTTGAGEVYDGEYSAGKRHGGGTLTRTDGGVFTGSWVRGVAIKDARDQPQLAQWDQPAGGATISVTTNAQKNAQTRNSGDGMYDPPITYRHKTTATATKIEPEDDRLLAIWADQGEAFDPAGPDTKRYADDYGILYGAPAWLSIKIQSHNQRSAELKKLFVKIDRSAPELRPFLAASGAALEVACDPPNADFSPKFRLINYGWGKSKSAEIEFSFANQNGAKSQKFKAPVGVLDQWTDVSVAEAVGELHGDVNKLKSAKLSCDYDYSDDEAGRCFNAATDVAECFRKHAPVAACLKQAKETAPLGNLAAYTDLGGTWGNVFYTTVDGVYRYSWVDGNGKTRASAAKFKAPISLASVKMKAPAECGDAGPDLPAAGVPVIELSPKKKSYQWTYPLKKPVKIPAEGKSFTIGAFAKSSSTHNFVVVAEFSDGSKSQSKPVELLYFRPRKVELPYEEVPEDPQPAGAAEQ